MIFVLEHLCDFWPGLVMCLITGLLLTSCPWGRKVIEPFAATRLDRMVVGLLLGSIIMVGWTKGPAVGRKHILQFVTALNDGRIVDESGLVVLCTEQQTVAAFADLSVAIANAASQTVVSAAGEFGAVAQLVTNIERKVIYIQSTLPRTDPYQGVINHNISGFIARTSMSEDRSVVSRYIWYSAQPLVAPTVACVVDVGGGDIKLCAITNTFPQTVEVDGIECVRYDYAVPETLRSVVYFPDTELSFGDKNTPLEVGIDGVSVDIEGETHLPFKGTDSYFDGRVQVEYAGGMATKVYIDGAAVTNGVYVL